MKNNKFSLFVCLLLCLFACANAIDEPENKIEPMQMSKILAEVTLSENLVFENPEYNTKAGFDAILKKFKITKNDFNKNYVYYLSQPEILDQILEDSQQIIKNNAPNFDAYLKKKESSNIQPE